MFFFYGFPENVEYNSLHEVLHLNKDCAPTKTFLRQEAEYNSLLLLPLVLTCQGQGLPPGASCWLPLILDGQGQGATQGQSLTGVSCWLPLVLAGQGQSAAAPPVTGTAAAWGAAVNYTLVK